MHYWEYPNEQLITLCKDCHSKETDLMRRFKKIKYSLDTNIVNSFESLMKQGVLLTSVLNTFELMGTKTTLSSKNTTEGTTPQSYHPVSLNIEEKKQLFLQALQPFESKYDKDYIQTFIEYWHSENSGKLRFEIDENGNLMNVIGISSDYMNAKLENWKSQYDIIVKERQSSFILDEIIKMEQVIKNDYIENKIELQCDEKFNYGIGTDRLFGKLLYDRKLFIKQYNEYDSFLHKEKKVKLCYPIESIKENEEKSLSLFCLLYEAKQAFKKNRDYNRSILSSIDSQISYRTFCDQYGIKYGHSLKKDKSIKDIVESLHFPIKLKYHYGAVNVFLRQDSNQKRLSKLNEVFGLKLLIVHRSLSTYFKVPFKILYQMDGTQFDFRDDSFEKGTMKSVKLPTEYKEASYYIDKIEELLNTD